MMFNFFPIAFAVFGFTYLVRYLDGPFDILKSFRKFVGIEYVPIYVDIPEELHQRIQEYVEEIPNKFFAKLVGCFWCLSTWVAMMFCITYAILYGISIFETITGIFICVGISGMLHEFVEKK